MAFLSFIVVDRATAQESESSPEVMRRLSYGIFVAIICQMKTAPKPPSNDPSAMASKVLTQAVLRSADLLGLSNAQLGRVLGISESSVSRLVAGDRQIDPASKEGELGLLLVRLYRSLDAVVGGDSDLRLSWLSSNNRALNGPPIALIDSTTGLVNTVAYLDSARARL